MRIRTCVEYGISGVCLFGLVCCVALGLGGCSIAFESPDLYVGNNHVSESRTSNTSTSPTIGGNRASSERLPYIHDEGSNDPDLIGDLIREPTSRPASTVNCHYVLSNACTNRDVDGPRQLQPTLSR